MKKLYSFITGILFLLLIVTFPQKANAQTAVTSAVLVTPAEILQKADDNRAKILQRFLESRNSPLAPYAQDFVTEADKNNIDWRLVAAISGLESSFGLHIPAYSYNGWGYGVYGNNVLRFSSWEEGIAVVSEGLRKNYMDKWNATSVYEIGRIYAASPTWAVRVMYFIGAIDAFEKEQKKNQLALSL